MFSSKCTSGAGRCLAAAAVFLAACGTARAVDGNTRMNGYRGIWFTIGQDNEYGPKYSGGLGTYTAKHRPIAVYAEQVNKTFFVYGGIVDNGTDLLIMASHYDHTTCLVPRPTVVHHKVGVNDPHDNAALLIDRDGYLWIFISGRGRARTGWIYRSSVPYSTETFEWVRGGSGEDFFEITYPQPWYITDGVETPLFFHMFTRYTAGRELYWATSTDGVHWSDDAAPPEQGTKLVGFGGHYQSSSEWHGKISTFFNYHPGGNVDRRTNLYYLQTTNYGQTWTLADRTPVSVPLNAVINPALIRNYQAEGLNVYVKDLNFDANGNPLLLFITSGGYEAGPSNDPRTWHLARWDGVQWIITDITTSTHNYDMGSLYVEGNTLRVIAPTEIGPQQYGTGGEVAVWISPDLGATWRKAQDVTRNSALNHTYVRRPLHARDPFYAYWADGNPLERSVSRLYFANRAGTRVWRLPFVMEDEFARPERVTDFGGTEAAAIWRSRFETAPGAPDPAGEMADVITNTVGQAGLATGSAPLSYVPYGSPQVGAAPVAGAGSFALSFPDDRTIGIDTKVASNAGNLTNAFTFEGFFRTPDAALISDPTYVGRRLVSQKREEGDGSSRVAIGLHAGTVNGSDGLVAYDGFDYSGTALDGQAGGIGWSAAWLDDDADFGLLSNDGVSLDVPGTFPFAPAGSRISGSVVGGGEGIRALNRSFDLGKEGETVYLSYLIKKNSTAPTSADNVEVGLDAGGSSAIVRTGMSSDDYFFLALSGGATTRGTAKVAAGKTYFVIVKTTAAASGNDTARLAFFESGSVPANEAAVSWEVTATGNAASVLSRVRLVLGGSANADLDEVRVGTSYQSVIDPAAPISQGGAANVLALFWYGGGSNHLGLGTQAVLPDTWYHFAVTFDGTDMNWYLNGALQGSASNPDLAVPGVAPIAIGNNRLSGASDRGFYGYIDQVRIADQALPPAEFLLSTGSCPVECGAAGGATLWCSDFETKPNASVVHEQVAARTCSSIQNDYGPAGVPAGVSDLAYMAYGQVGVGQAPAASAGDFALFFPDDRSVSIDTRIPSDDPNLTGPLTFEGFFNSFDTAAVTSPSSIGRRLVTQKRSDLEAESRLAIGVHAAASGGHNLLSVFWRDAAGGNHVVPGVTPIEPGRWYHFALTYESTALTAYLDGQVESQVLNPDLAPAGSATIVVGNNRVSGLADRGFFGLIDEVRITGAALLPKDFLLPDSVATADNPCVFGCGWPFADTDGDSDVDQADFGTFQRCYTEESTIMIDPAVCYCFDRDGDDDVDLDDFEAFVNCSTGPGTVWTQGSAPDCNP